MNEIVSKNPIVKKIAEGGIKEDLLDLLMAKQLPFTEEEYLESLIFVLKIESVKSKALEMLKQISESTKVSYVEKSNANYRVAYYILLESLNSKNSKIISRIIKNQAFPVEFLLKIAESGDSTILEALLDNQIKLIAFPQVMDTMEKNKEITNFIRGKITEIREFYINKSDVQEIQASEVMDDVKEILSKPSVDETSDSENLPQENLDDMSELEQKTLTILQEINNMSISERIKLALTGSKTHRLILLKDSNKMVSLSVVESPKLTTDEVLLIARNRSLPSEIVAKVSKNREWVKNYAVVVELAQNPKTPIKEALGFLTKLHIQDLKLLSRNKNINSVVRQVAHNFLTQREEKKK